MFERLPQDFTCRQGRTCSLFQCSVAVNMNDSVAKGMKLQINRFLYVTYITKDLLDMGLDLFMH